MPQYEFSERLLLNEAVQMLKDHLRAHQIVYLGKIGWWQGYSAVNLPNLASNNRIFTLQEYKNKTIQSVLGTFAQDSVADNPMYWVNSTNEAAKRLGNLGFPQEGGVLLFIDLSNH